MSKYKFRADEVSSIYTVRESSAVFVELNLTTPQAKDAFLTLAGDTRGDELGLWMAELGYTISEIETVDCHV